MSLSNNPKARNYGKSLFYRYSEVQEEVEDNLNKLENIIALLRDGIRNGSIWILRSPFIDELVFVQVKAGVDEKEIVQSYIEASHHIEKQYKNSDRIRESEVMDEMLSNIAIDWRWYNNLEIGSSLFGDKIDEILDRIVGYAEQTGRYIFLDY